MNGRACQPGGGAVRRSEPSTDESGRTSTGSSRLPPLPKPGDVLLVDGRASVQFAGDRAVVLRVVSVPGWPTYYGWCWLVGYVLGPNGLAVERRELFVQLSGLRPALVPSQPRRRVQTPTAARPASGRARGATPS